MMTCEMETKNYMIEKLNKLYVFKQLLLDSIDEFKYENYIKEENYNSILNENFKFCINASSYKNRDLTYYSNYLHLHDKYRELLQIGRNELYFILNESIINKEKFHDLLYELEEVLSFPILNEKIYYEECENLLHEEWELWIKYEFLNEIERTEKASYNNDIYTEEGLLAYFKHLCNYEDVLIYNSSEIKVNFFNLMKNYNSKEFYSYIRWKEFIYENFNYIWNLGGIILEDNDITIYDVIYYLEKYMGRNNFILYENYAKDENEWGIRQTDPTENKDYWEKGINLYHTAFITCEKEEKEFLLKELNI